MASLQRYWAFYQVAEAGSFSAAAERLYLSQPGLSAAVKQLERELGVSLFRRHARGVHLTAEGAALFGHLRQAYRAVDEGERLLGEMRRLQTGTVRVGASDALTRQYLLPVLSRFHATHPGVRLRVRNGTTSQIAEMVRDGRVDAGLVNLPLAVHGLRVLTGPITSDCFVAAPSRRDLAGGPVSLDRLAAEPLVLLDAGSVSRRHADQHFAAHGASLKPDIELGSLDLVAAFAQAGIAVGLVPEALAAPRVKVGTLIQVALDPPLPPRQVALLSPDGPPPSAALDAFLDTWGWEADGADTLD